MTVTLKVLDMIQSRVNQGDTEPVQKLTENAMVSSSTVHNQRTEECHIGLGVFNKE
jgi:hypothetical protein